MAKKEIFVITGTEVEDTGKVSFKFMFDSKAPYKTFARYAGIYGWLHRHPKSPDEIDIRKFVNGDPNCVGDDGTLRWSIYIFDPKQNGQIFNASFPDRPEQELEKNLIETIKDLPDCVLLMSRDLFDRFKKACDSIPDITLGVHHYEGELATA